MQFKREWRIFDACWEKADWAHNSIEVDYPELWPVYRQMIKEPMDLGEGRRRLEGGRYQPEPGVAVLPGFQRDVRLVWENAMTFNAAGSEYHKKAAKMLKRFNKWVSESKLKSSPDKEDTAKNEAPTASPQALVIRKRAAPEDADAPPAKRVADAAGGAGQAANLSKYKAEREIALALEKLGEVLRVSRS